MHAEFFLNRIYGKKVLYNNWLTQNVNVAGMLNFKLFVASKH